MAQTLPIVLLPGMMCDQRMWQAQSDYLTAHGYTVIVGDITGRGLGDQRERVSIDTIARALLATLPRRFALAGLSMGGIVALAMWRLAAERIDRLALLDTSALADTPQRREQRDLQILAAQQGQLETLLVEEMKPNYLAESNKRDELALQTLLAMAMDLGVEVFIRQSLALKHRVDSMATLATIDCPTLVLCGEEDALCPVAHHQQIAKAISAASLVVLDNCGHLSTMEQPDQVNTALNDWLNI